MNEHNLIEQIINGETRIEMKILSINRFGYYEIPSAVALEIRNIEKQLTYGCVFLTSNVEGNYNIFTPDKTVDFNDEKLEQYKLCLSIVITSWSELTNKEKFTFDASMIKVTDKDTPYSQFSLWWSEKIHEKVHNLYNSKEKKEVPISLGYIDF